MFENMFKNASKGPAKSSAPSKPAFAMRKKPSSKAGMKPLAEEEEVLDDEMETAEAEETEESGSLDTALADCGELRGLIQDGNTEEALAVVDRIEEAIQSAQAA